MRYNSTMDKTEFYAECDRLLGQHHPPPKTYGYRGRWGPREPGSGRFEGYGLIRWMSQRVVHIALRHPVHLQTHATPERALEILAEMMETR